MRYMIVSFFQIRKYGVHDEINVKNTFIDMI